MTVDARYSRYAIIGAGLSGLYAAYLLERNGITDYLGSSATHPFFKIPPSAAFSRMRLRGVGALVTARVGHIAGTDPREAADSAGDAKGTKCYTAGIGLRY